jgi:hypothetical protein
MMQSWKKKRFESYRRDTGEKKQKKKKKVTRRALSASANGSQIQESDDGLFPTLSLSLPFFFSSPTYLLGKREESHDREKEKSHRPMMDPHNNNGRRRRRERERERERDAVPWHRRWLSLLLWNSGSCKAASRQTQTQEPGNQTAGPHDGTLAHHRRRTRRFCIGHEYLNQVFVPSFFSLFFPFFFLFLFLGGEISQLGELGFRK